MKIVVPCNVYSRAVHKKESKTYDKSFDASLRVWISDLYNFDKDEDYYHVVLEETFDGSQCYAGQWWSVKTDKLGHQVRISCDILARKFDFASNASRAISFFSSISC